MSCLAAGSDRARAAVAACQAATKLGLSSLHSSLDSAETLATAVADIFQVSKQAALIRLDTLQLLWL